MTPLAQIPTLPAEALRALALDAVPQGPGAHWSLLALALGRIEEQHFYREFGHYASARAFAVEELGLPPDEARVLIEKLAPMLVSAFHAGVPWAAWALVPKSRAVALVKVLAMGGDSRRWVEAAGQVTSTAAFLASIKEALGEEVWRDFTVRVPAGLVPLLERAMQLALAEVVDGPPGRPDRWQDPDMGHQVLEEIMREYINTRSAYA